MDSKYVRKTIDDLIAELERNPAIGRRMSPSFMSRYGRPLGLGIALGVSGALGCSGSSEESKDNPDALPAGKDALPGARDAYGISWEVLSPTYDVYVRPLDVAVDVYGISAADARVDTRDALPFAVDAYGMTSPDRPADSRDALSPDYDVYVRPLDTGRVDAYGIAADARLDTRDAPPVADAGGDALPDDMD